MTSIVSGSSLHPLGRLAVVALALSLAACDEPGGPTSGGTTPEAYVVAGRVVDGAGEPLAGAEVVIDNQLQYDSNVLGVTDADGRYTLALPEVAATWHATAYHTVDYHGSTYTFDLDPHVDDPFSGDAGAVRDFTWRLSGERPDGGSYGGFVVGYAEPGDFSFDLLSVELTLAPDGPLVDGSTGDPITGRLERTADGDALVDVPVGRYAITAEVEGEPLEVRVRNSGDPFVGSVTADFDVPYGSLPIHRIELELRRP